MGLTYKKEAQLREQPIIRSRMWKSKSGQYMVFQTTITEIKPVAYIDKVLEDEEEEAEMDVEELFQVAEA